MCNRHRSNHHDQHLVDHVNEVWNWKNHSEPIAATCYGTLSQSNSPVSLVRYSMKIILICLYSICAVT